MKRVIVIGASSGIGKGLAGLFAENECKVGITGRNEELLEELKNTKTDSFLVKPFDISDIHTSIDKLQELISELGGLDMLIYCSGTGDLNETLDFNIDKKVIDVNVSGFTNIVNWAYNLFETQASGHLVAITSVGGLRGSRQAPSYNATKSYQINYLEGLRQKAAKLKKPVFVTDVRPGLVDTKMAKGEGLFWVMPVEKVAQQIFRAIQRKRKVVYVTKRWGIIARIFKILPRWVYDKM